TEIPIDDSGAVVNVMVLAGGGASEKTKNRQQNALIDLLQVLSYWEFSNVDFLGKVQEMAKDSDMRITRLLFCGPHFPASTNYTREYLCKYPFIQDSMTLFECFEELIVERTIIMSLVTPPDFNK
ncbi:hypothetical protein RJ639_039803, partial [Escallonia herrerae]